MKSKLLSALIIGGTAMASQMAAAADGTITFTGNVTAQTCAINGGATNFVVALPTVSASSLSAAGKTAGRTPFSIALSGCTPTAGNVRTFFEAGPNTDASTGRLNLTAGGAQRVQIGLQNASDETNINVGFANALQNSKSVPLASGAATLRYYAQYVATGAATAGAANTSVMYSIAYQ
ncbi:major type 1 subunit fimbrin (pilin) [Cupriavidus sp. OV038]|jgi:major type 1 subunit fimbrin (pilin)|uniref:fimbrial protein n=1 Tax=unclassified Cupriavidus TaxID=2640874 RepID=UPI0008E38AB1|nr:MULTISPECIES: fimbrial protein [unclassified Cupriavidus]SFB90708.1 major type 1 subunit fimbrin (pilin) [Cupriavidus sp. OV038]SFO99611.1 major type 1 subunit fimbrin (pilin) [Cupriavidus sp. OV096]